MTLQINEGRLAAQSNTILTTRAGGTIGKMIIGDFGKVRLNLYTGVLDWAKR